MFDTYHSFIGALYILAGLLVLTAFFIHSKTAIINTQHIDFSKNKKPSV
jgi:hypothetical protein